jgi:hypothetical protein
MVVDNGIKISGIYFQDQNNEQISNNIVLIKNELINKAVEQNI